MRKRLPGYSISLDRKKQYSQSRLQMAPVGLAITWNATGAPGIVRIRSVVPALRVMAAHLFPREHRLGLALHVDVGLAADVDSDPLDGAAGEPGPVVIRVVAGHRRAAVAADAQAFARDREHPGLGLDAALADLGFAVVQRQDAGGDVRW